MLLDQILPCVVIDFETRSQADLPTVGIDNYCADPTTGIIAVSAIVCTEDDRQGTLYATNYKADDFESVMRGLADACADAESEGADLTWVAHNADGFDAHILESVRVIGREVFRDYFDPGIPPDYGQWLDSQTLCRIHGIPASLGNAARFLKTPTQKNPIGDKLINKFSKPGFAEPTPADMAEWMTYVTEDSEIVWDILNALPETDLEPLEADAVALRQINARGIALDMDLVNAAVKLTDKIRRQAHAEVAELTGGVATKYTQLARIKKWLLATDCPGYYDGGSLDEDARRTLLAGMDCDAHPDQADVLDLLGIVNKSSMSKFTSMQAQRSTDDNRLRNQYVHAGAGQTQRYSSRGVQIHNLKRATLKPADVDELQDAMASHNRIGQFTDWPIVNTMTKALRPAFIPKPDHTFVIGDWSNIEARKLPWLAGTPDAQLALDMYRAYDAAPSPETDPYLLTAADVGFPGQRQIGKVAVLALGFGGGVGAFQSMAANYGVDVSDAVAERVKEGWREANPWAPMFWKRLQRCALRAMHFPNQPCFIDPSNAHIAYTYLPDALNGLGLLRATLLDSDTHLYYAAPQLSTDKYKNECVTFALASRVAAKNATAWPRDSLWGGLQAENLTQAGAAVLLRAVMRMSDITKHCVMHTHDEVVLEVPTKKAKWWSARLTSAMTTDLEPYFPDLPLAAEVYIAPRYMKDE